MEALTRTYDELPAEIQPEGGAGTAPEQARSSSSGLDEAEAENPEPAGDVSITDAEGRISTPSSGIFGPIRRGGFSNRRPFQFDPNESVFNN